VKKVSSKIKTIAEFLDGIKYSVNYYDGDYRWLAKQIREFIEDLASKFLERYEPDHPSDNFTDYSLCFLGSFIICKKDDINNVIDGQQRLTSLLLLLILLRNLQKDNPKQINIDNLIFSIERGYKSFNLDIDERAPVMEALSERQPFNIANVSEPVRNLIYRYVDLETSFPEELHGDPLPYFVNWLLTNVYVNEITTYSFDDAYAVFETLNDSGLSLSPSDKLKTYILSNIDEKKRPVAINRFRKFSRKLNEYGGSLESDFFKTWLKSQYATKIRQRGGKSKPEDFDRIGNEFYWWFCESTDALGLHNRNDFFKFINDDFSFYSSEYFHIIKASQKPSPGLERMYYNAELGFKLQNLLLLASIQLKDSKATVLLKYNLVAHFIDILLAWLIWNSQSISCGNMQYYIFTVMLEIRGLNIKPLARRLYSCLREKHVDFIFAKIPHVNSQNRYYLHRILARLTDYVETQSGLTSRYVDYVREGILSYEVKHICPDDPEHLTKEFTSPDEFTEYRNRIGGLLLLPKDFNPDYIGQPYEECLSRYNAQNLLARSLNPLSYNNDLGFLEFIEKSGLPFQPHYHFKMKDIDARTKLYQSIAKQIWNPEHLLI
jgi:uncharacterized protein with ParB-like and HNH nuclease domain